MEWTENGPADRISLLFYENENVFKLTRILILLKLFHN